MTDDDKHRALDPAIAERAALTVLRLRSGLDNADCGADGERELGGVVLTMNDAADLITTTLAQNAALRAERDALIEWNGQASVRAESAEDRAEAAEAKVEKLRGALQIARVHVANNAEGWSVSRGAARDDLTIVDAALTTEEGHE